MHSYVRLTPGPGFRPVRAALYYSQRTIVWPPARKAIARALAGLINLRQGPVSRTAGASGTLLKTLEAKGLALLPDLFSADEIGEVHGFLLPRPLTRSNAYTLETVLKCPHILRIAGDARILALARAYLGCQPTLASIGIRWSFCQRPTDVQLFHRDMDDWRFLKVFVYLTDVDAASGPHVYVLGSHKTKGRLRARPYQLEEIEADYGAEAVFRILGQAGTSFIADTYGIHRGEFPAAKPRLLLQIQYSILPNFSLLYRPVPLAVGQPALDRYSRRLLFK